MPTAPTTLASRNPWDNSPIATFPLPTERELADAIPRARKALKDWSRDEPLRRHVLTTLPALLTQHRQELATLISRETGKVLWESLLEVDAMINKCPLTLRAQDERRAPTSKPGPGGTTLATTYRPHGIALVLGPFNFPGHLPLGHIAPALLAGNAVLFKPSDKAPAVGAFLTDLLHQAGTPADILQCHQGGRETAQHLFQENLNAVLFTGSYDVGVKIAETFARRPGVLLALELGGNNPLIAWDLQESSLPAAVLTLLQSAFATGGQRCSCTRRLILPQYGTFGDALLSHLIAATDRLRPGKYDDDPQPFYGTLINKAAADDVLFNEDALANIPDGQPKHRKLLLQAKRDGGSPALLSPSIVDATSALNYDSDDEPPPTDFEIFGPLLQVYRVSTFDEALEVANNTQYGLCSGLLTDNPALWPHFRQEAQAGILTLNRPTTGASSELPFGGIGHSGNHRPSAYHAPDYCSYPVGEMSADHLTLPEKLPPGIKL